MAAASYYSGATMERDLTDLGALWQAALLGYRQESGIDLMEIAAGMDVSAIMAEQQRQLFVFGEFRHSKGKLDKLRSLVSRNSTLVSGIVTHGLNAASAAFPPSSAILAAFNAVMSASKAVSDDFDMILAFFDIMNSFLERISLLEKRMPQEPPFQRSLMSVFTSLLALCAIARKYRKDGRMKKWAKALLSDDSSLKAAYDDLHKYMERLESTIMLATLRTTIDSSAKLDSIQAGVNQALEIGQQSLAVTQQSYYLGLGTQSYAKDAAANTHEIVAITTEQMGRLKSMERTLRKTVRGAGAAAEDTLDAGARKSAALKQLQRLLAYDLDDIAQVTEFEATAVDGTGDWFGELDEYVEFEAGDTRLLWITGPSGVGKSTLTWRVAKRLRDDLRADMDASVAHFFFREDLDSYRSVSRMLRSCAIQVAANDVQYREALLTDLQRIREGIDTQDAKMLWERLFKRRFDKGATSRLVLVLDGVDEAEDGAAEHIKAILADISSSDHSHISVLFTSDTKYMDAEEGKEEAAEADQAIKVRRYELDGQKMAQDMRAIAVARLKTLSRLRKLSRKTRRKIRDKLAKQADTPRYLEHMLRRFNALGREKAILRELDSLPASTTALYELLLADCSRSRSGEDKDVLRRLFAWLAYSKQPLGLASAGQLLHFIAKDNGISIDEELEHRCARLLRLSNSTQDDDQDQDSDLDSLEEEPNRKAAETDEGAAGEDMNVFLAFQERSLRNYFRQNDVQESGLRSSQSEGNLLIFEVIANILTEPRRDEAYEKGWHLLHYATNYWMAHLLDIKAADLTDVQVVRVIECICAILTNRDGSLRTMEQYATNSWEDPTVFGGTDEGNEKALKTLQAWSERAARLPSSALSPFIVAWMRPLVRNPKSIYIKLAEAHATNLLASYDTINDSEVARSFRFAHRALELARDLPGVQQKEELCKYFAERDQAEDKAFTAESHTIVSKAFLHIERTAQSYKNLGMAMKFEGLYQDSVKQMEQGLLLADNDRDRVQLYSEMGEAYLELYSTADEDEETKAADDKEAKAADDKKDEEGPDDANKTAKGEEGRGEDKKTKEECVRAARDVLAKATGLDIKLSENPKEDQEVRSSLVFAYVNLAMAELNMGRTEDTVALVTSAQTIASEKIWMWCGEMFTKLEEKAEWAKIMSLLHVLDKSRVWIYLQDECDRIHHAAVATGEADFLIELYHDSVKRQPAWNAELWTELAFFYQRVLAGTAHDDAAARARYQAEAKKLLYRIMETSNLTQYISRAHFSLADMLLEEFRQARVPHRKEAAFAEMAALAQRIAESMGGDFDPAQSQTTIPLALMTRKVRTLDFQKRLEEAFDGCVRALTDEFSWNDAVSFRTLAKVLACVPGLETEAGVAATCQLYIIDMDKYEKDNVQSAPGSPKKEEEEEGKEKEEVGEQQIEKDGGEAQVKVAAVDPKPVAGVNGVVKEGGTTNGVIKEGGATNGLADVDGVTEKKEEGEAKEEKEKEEEDLDRIYGKLRCSSCQKTVSDWREEGSRMYLCYYCTELNLCEACHTAKTEREAGTRPADWRVLCPPGHRHVAAPVAGWQGLRGGVFTINGTRTRFVDWLVELKEKKWPEAWDRFWSDELCA